MYCINGSFCIEFSQYYSKSKSNHSLVCAEWSLLSLLGLGCEEIVFLLNIVTIILLYLVLFRTQRRQWFVYPSRLEYFVLSACNSVLDDVFFLVMTHEILLKSVSTGIFTWFVGNKTFIVAKVFLRPIWFSEVLECDFVVIVGILGDSFFYPLGFNVITHHSIFAQCRWNWFHLHIEATVFLFGLDDLALCDGFEEGGFFVDSVRWSVWSVTSEGFDAFEFDEKFDVRLVDL